MIVQGECPLSLRVVSAHMGQALIIAASNLSKYFIIHKKFATIFNGIFYKNQTIFHILSQIGGGILLIINTLPSC